MNHLLYDAAVSKPVANIVNWAFAEAYPEAGQDRYFVFELDSTAIRDWNSSDRAWPPEYATHGTILKGLVDDFQPAAIFYDIYFEGLRNDPHDRGDNAATFDAFLRTICELGPCAPASEAERPRCRAGATLSETNAIIMFGRPLGTPGKGAEAHRRLEALVESCPHLAMAPILVPKAPALQRYYLLDVPGRDTSADGDDAAPRNASIALYARLCRAGRLSAGDDCEATLARATAIRDADASMELIWGPASRPASIAANGLARCGEGRPLRRMTASDFEAFARLDEVDHRGRRPAHLSLEAGWTCPYSHGLLASDLYDRQGVGPAPETEDFAGRTIFVGRSPTDSSDIYASGSSGMERLTGVYAHAMAFDNLLAYGPNIKSSLFILPGSSETTAVIMGLLSVGIWLTSLLASEKLDPGSRMDSGLPLFLARSLSEFLVVLLSAAAICLVLFFLADIGPQTWASLTAYGAGTAYLATAAAGRYRA